MLEDQQQVVKESSSRYLQEITRLHRAKKVALLRGMERLRELTKCSMQVHLQAQCLEKAPRAPMDPILIDKVKCERQRHSLTVAVKWSASKDSSCCAAMQRTGYKQLRRGLTLT